MSSTTKRKLKYVTLSVVMLLLTALMAIPLYFIVVSTFKNSVQMSTSPFGLPDHPTISNYMDAFTKVPLARNFLNTIIVTVISVVLQVFIGSLAAYGMILKKTKAVTIFGGLLLFTFTVPVQAVMIPLYKMVAGIGIVDNLAGIVVVYLGSSVFCYFLIVGYMRKIPMELLEAARIDGAGPFRIYWSIVLPLIRPILATVVVFQTLATWNDFLWPNLMLTTSENRTVVLQVFSAVSQFTTNWPLFMAITVIALVPVFVFFVFCQRYIVSGLVGGAVKG